MSGSPQTLRYTIAILDIVGRSGEMLVLVLRVGQCPHSGRSKYPLSRAGHAEMELLGVTAGDGRRYCVTHDLCQNV